MKKFLIAGCLLIVAAGVMKFAFIEAAVPNYDKFEDDVTKKKDDPLELAKFLNYKTDKRLNGLIESNGPGMKNIIINDIILNAIKHDNKKLDAAVRGLIKKITTAKENAKFIEEIKAQKEAADYLEKIKNDDTDASLDDFARGTFDIVNS